MATVTKPLLFAALALAAFVLIYPAVRDRLPDQMNYLGNRAPVVSQSASQLSSGEFAQVDSGFTPTELRAFAGNPATKTLGDKWTVVTADGSLSAHFEHTVAITANGPRILTAA